MKGDPYVIEYNARLGDPESEAIIPRIKSDLFDLIEGVAKGDLEKRDLIIDEQIYYSSHACFGRVPGPL